MKYLYGDATPFPLDENFIDTIGAAVDACVALFQADSDAVSKRVRALQVQKIADEELRRLDVLGKAIQAALRPMVADGKPERPAQAAAQRIGGSAVTTIKNARAGVMRRRDAAMRAAIGDQLGQRVFEAIEHFLLRHQLPKTQWSLRWTAGERAGEARAQALAVGPSKLQSTFSIAIPDARQWSGPLRLAALEPSLILKLQRSGGVLRRGPRISKVALHKLHITEIEISSAREGFVLRTSARKPSPGYRVVMFENDQSTPTITRIDEEGRSAGKPMTLAGEDAVALGRLWNAIHRGMYDLLRYRGRAETIRLGDTPARQLDEPAELAEAILSALAPLVRQMRLRSRVPGELVLKRDLGDGRREELFVPRREIELKYSVLSSEHRACFEAIGLGGEATREFVTREFPLAPRAESATGPTSHPLARAQRLATQDEETHVAA